MTSKSRAWPKTRPSSRLKSAASTPGSPWRSSITRPAFGAPRETRGAPRSRAQRSERPGKPVALLDHAPSVRSAPGNPWRSSITRPAFGAPRETRGAPRSRAQRSERPGKPVALLDHAPSVRSAPGNPWRSSITRPAFGAPRETRGAPRSRGQRSERPGKPVALLDHAPSVRSAPGNPWRSSITRPAFGAPRETRGAPRRSGRKVAEHAARTAAVGDDAALVDRAHAVHPHAVHADAGRVEPLGARRQIVYAALLAARDGGRIEQQEVGPCAGREPAAVRDAIRGGDVARHP